MRGFYLIDIIMGSIEAKSFTCCLSCNQIVNLNIIQCAIYIVKDHNSLQKHLHKRDGEHQKGKKIDETGDLLADKHHLGLVIPLELGEILVHRKDICIIPTQFISKIYYDYSIFP